MDERRCASRSAYSSVEVETFARTWERERFQVEEAFWWYRARREIIVRLVRARRLRGRILDIGCSSGLLMQALDGLGFDQVYGIDISEPAIERCRSRGLTTTQVMDGAKTGFPGAAFDVAIASDVLEHIADESGALQEWYRILEPGGTLVVFVPAFESLWSAWDDLNSHCRRYTRASLMKALRANRFVVSRTSYWNAGLFLPTVGLRVAERLFSRPPDYGAMVKQVPRLVNRLMCRVLSCENALVASGINCPAGLSVFAIAVKPG